MKHFNDELRGLLRKGFCADNLAEIARLAHEAAMSTDRPLGFLVLWTIFLMLSEEWGERPLPVDVAEQMAHYLLPPIDSFLQTADARPSPEVEAEYLNEIARQFLSWLQVQTDLPWQ